MYVVLRGFNRRRSPPIQTPPHSVSLAIDFRINPERITMKWKALAATLLLGVASAAQAVTADEVKTFTLPNGMKFIVLESTSIPNATMYTFWKVGSRNEAPGITGLSHFFEHMMFNGSKKYGPKMFDRTMEANGGANNAY